MSLCIRKIWIGRGNGDKNQSGQDTTENICDVFMTESLRVHKMKTNKILTKRDIVDYDLHST